MNADKLKILSGSVLKMIAVIAMLCDHIAFFVLSKAEFAKRVLFTFGSIDFSVYNLMRTFGRIAFPLFCFLLVEGFIHTKDRKKYGIALFVFAIISELPWNLVFSKGFFYGRQNVLFTLFLGYLGLCSLEKYKEHFIRQAICLISLFIVAVLLKADYGYVGYSFILMLYVLRNSKVIQAIIGICLLSHGFRAGIAFVFINMYNGQRGFIRGKVAKYGFYLFYPLHLLILYFVKIHMSL